MGIFLAILITSIVMIMIYGIMYLYGKFLIERFVNNITNIIEERGVTLERAFDEVLYNCRQTKGLHAYIIYTIVDSIYNRMRKMDKK